MEPNQSIQELASTLVDAANALHTAATANNPEEYAADMCAETTANAAKKVGQVSVILSNTYKALIFKSEALRNKQEEAN